jgi:hypothetical protein
VRPRRVRVSVPIRTRSTFRWPLPEEFPPSGTNLVRRVVDHSVRGVKRSASRPTGIADILTVDVDRAAVEPLFWHWGVSKSLAVSLRQTPGNLNCTKECFTDRVSEFGIPCPLCFCSSMEVSLELLRAPCQKARYDDEDGFHGVPRHKERLPPCTTERPKALAQTWSPKVWATGHWW